MRCDVQRVFRGWRARRRVVWQVREQVEALAAAIRREMATAEALPGSDAAALAASCEVSWLAGGGRLHLPRMRDDVFGFVFDFPSSLSLSPDGGSEPTSGDEGVEDVDAARPRSDSNSSSSSDGFSSRSTSVAATSNRSTSDFLTARDVAVPDSGRRVDRLHSVAQGHAEASESKQKQPVIAPAARGQETPGDAAVSVDDVLATYSKAEVLLELQWARQALRERRKVRRHSPCVLLCGLASV
jgi:hypothetical protein